MLTIIVIFNARSSSLLTQMLLPELPGGNPLLLLEDRTEVAFTLETGPLNDILNLHAAMIQEQLNAL